MAGIIKSGQVHDTGSLAQLALFNFEDMSTKADTYLEAIRRQAGQILVQAKEQAAAIQAEAQKKGRQEAVKEVERYAANQVEQQLQSLVPALQQAVQSIEHAREAWIKRWESDTIQLALEVARKIVRRELSSSPEISMQWIRESLELVTGEGRLCLHLSPADYESLGGQAQLLIDRISKNVDCRIVPNPAIEAGGCRVETEFGVIDQQLSSQIERIREELWEE